MALTNLNAAVAWTQQSVNTAANGRLHIGAFIPGAASITGLTGWRDGVIVSTNQGGSSNIPNDLQVKAVTPTPSMSLTCEAGHCVITRSGQGPYLCYLATQGTLTLAASDTVNARIDRIVAQVYDTTIGDSLAGLSPSLSSPGGLVIRAVTGTPSGSPSAPATPTGAISLATVAVAANATAITNGNITDTRRGTSSPAGARPLLPGDSISDAGAVTGETRYFLDQTHSGMWVWTGAAWLPVMNTVAGARYTRNSQQSIASSTNTKIAWTTTEHNNAGVIGETAGVLTILKAGLYTISGGLKLGAIAGGGLDFYIWLGHGTNTTSSDRYIEFEGSLATTGNRGTGLCTERRFNVNDTLALWTWHNNASAVLTSSDFQPFLTAHFKGL